MSIQRQLVVLIISTITLASFFAALQGYRNSITQLDTMFDQELKLIANFIASTDRLNQIVPSDIEGDFVYQVFHGEKLISKSENVPVSPIYSKEKDFDEQFFYGKRWRTYSLFNGKQQVVVAHPTESRILSAEAILFVTITPIVISIPLIALIVFYIIRKSLKPLRTLSRQLKQKNMDDLSSINIKDCPEELGSVIARMNNLFYRLDSAFEREKQLTANAAHELRTPISVLSVTAHNLLEDFQSKELTDKSFDELNQNVQRMAHVIEQIIALYRFSPENFAISKEPIEIESVLQEMISNNYEKLSQLNQNITLESNQHFVLGERFALYTLFENLLINAIKYSGNNAEIIIKVVQLNHQFSVTIEDSGPGINETEIKKIFEKFYRSTDQQTRVKGSGLGLSIVTHIADMHKAKIDCFRSSLGGLAVRVTFDEILNENSDEI